MPIEIALDVEEALLKEDSWPAGGRRLIYSYSGEDRFLSQIFADVQDGFYVDFGCFHPVVNSNTIALHRRGWKGMNIDANPHSILEFRKQRPSDINQNIAIAKEVGFTNLYFFNPFAPSNTVNSDFAAQISSGQNVAVKEIIKVECLPTAEIVRRYMPENRVVDFWNIDLETLDCTALETNDWELFRPRVIAVEDFDYIMDAPSSKIHQLLRDKGYSGIARYHYTSFYVDPLQASGLTNLPRFSND